MTRSFGPLMEVARIQSEINRLFDNLLDLGAGETDEAKWIPNVDILESPEMLIVKAELPGVRIETLTLNVTSGDITIEGDKERPDGASPARFQLAERSFGPFRRAPPLNRSTRDAFDAGDHRHVP